MSYLTRRNFLYNTSVASFVAPLLAKTGHTADQTKPNVVFFYIDDLGWRDVGFMGSDFYETPNVDCIAAEGLVFTNAYANAPNCAPSRACLLTGKYTPRHGVHTVGSPERGKSKNRKLIPVENKTVLDPSFTTVPELFKKAGYKTAHMGKWHMGNDPEAGPKAQGYDVNIGGYSAGHPRSYFSPYQNPELQDGPEGEYLTERMGQEATKFIKKNQKTPFFLMMSLYAVHTPLRAKQELINKYENKAPGDHHNHAVYAAMVEGMDNCVGTVLDTLDELGLDENTVVIFYSDNGGYGPATSMHPLRGAKGMIYEGGIRVPLAIRWPGVVKAGRTCTEPVIGCDFFTTFLDLLGQNASEYAPIDGKSLLPILRQSGSVEREALYWHFPAYLEAYQNGEGPWRTTPVGAVRHGDFKLIEFFEDGKQELYNLVEDIGESNNLAEAMPDKATELHQMLKAWREDTNAPVPTKLNPEYIEKN